MIDSRPVQRLRQIHQLAMTSLIYPGATHRRFEHSMGVMQMATQIYDVVTDPEHVRDEIKQSLPEIHDEQKLMNWRAILRMAALCHDIGHLPFSHAAEEELLPAGWSHERLTYELIMGDEMAAVWNGLDPFLRPDLIAKIALGAKALRKFKPEEPFSDWEAIVSEIIVGDDFGADRMDYLLRDSYHTGVAYGHFDHFRLVDTVRILPQAPSGPADDQRSTEPTLGIQQGGMQAAEAMMLARFFIFSQVYYHRGRIIYDLHLLDFLKEWLPSGQFSTDLNDHLSKTDNEVMTALLEASRNGGAAGHRAAQAIVERSHFRSFYEPTATDTEYERPASQVFESARDKFGADKIRHAKKRVKVGPIDYPVEMQDGTIASGSSQSVVKVTPQDIEYVYVEPALREEAKKWLAENRASVIKNRKGTGE